MKRVEIQQDILSFEETLANLAERAAAGERSELYPDARADADALMCLLEEAAKRHRPKVLYLLERYEALLVTLVN